MDCKHFDTSDLRSGIAAAEADLYVVGVYADQIRAQGNMDLAVAIYRQAMLVRDIDMVVNTLMLCAVRSLRKWGTDAMPAILDYDKTAAVDELLGWALAIDVAVRMDLDVDGAAEAIEFERDELQAMYALGDTCTIGLCTMTLGEHLESYTNEGFGMAEVLRDLRELILERHRQFGVMHKLDFEGVATHHADTILSAHTEGLTPC